MTTTTLDTPRLPAARLATVNWSACALALAALLAAPLFLGDYYLHAMVLAMIFLLPALGLNLILGYTGMLSLAQGVFFGIGAYASALMSLHFGTPFFLNFLIAGAVAGLIALPLGIPALRLRDTSFVMCTLGLVVIAQMVSKNWIDLTRGDMGLSGVPRPRLGFGDMAFTVIKAPDYFYLVLVLAAIAVAAFVALIRSPAGRCMVAIRDNEMLAESLGVPTWTYKLIVFMLSAVFAGLGGSLYAHFSTVVSPLVFQSYYSNTILIIVLGGGVGRVPGAIIGSFVFVAVSEALRITPELRMVIYGFVLLGLVFLFPKGLAPLFERFAERIAGIGRAEKHDGR
ncbi:MULTISPECIES: branched-chain amino acid ABC transporter permease [unclassified Variovorax]|uniref:branched-chain amino acid ABC transporter permease n=1 Tax=unclassified Variovorax TaxID=663243 RepID=UPI0013196C58|nr:MULTISPECIES: branched-chain amino acid ABC transporter permease [unclassified Variovorax]VTU23665.1 leucine/isoleucine/valine transporter permease subunit [Variovorax sp. SRS16]VTU31884.1 leucine/isoleucine/valine transporter permease subunit [Variovorax sp. PBL-E5]